MSVRRAILAASFAALASGAASAAPMTFSGQDDGASTDGPFPNSDAAAASFLASAATYGALATQTYETLTPGQDTSYALGNGVTVSLSGPNDGPGYTGVSNTTFGNLYGFNTTPGGSQWLGFPGGSATFTFSQPTYSFGTYITGIQTVFTSNLSYTLADGTTQTLSLPINENGGAQYFGVTDADGFTSLTITNTSTESGDDAWGIDDTTYNVSSVPLPASAPLFGAALVALGVVGYGLRRKPAVSA